MPYLGREGQFGVRNRFQYLASAGDTSFSGADANGITMTFDDGLYVDVFLNGVKLKAGEDYNTNTANTIAGITALDANDEIEVIAYDAFSAADTVSAADGGTFSGAVTMTGNHTVGGNLAVPGTSTLTNTLTANSGIVIANDANIGSASDTDSMAINSSGIVTFTQIPVIASNPCFFARLGSNQTGVANATYTKATLDTEDFDVGGYFDSSTNYRYTPLITGYYQFNIGFYDLSNTDVYDQIVILYKNGSATNIAARNRLSISGDNEDLYASTITAGGVLFADGVDDYFELYFRGTSEDAGNITAGSGWTNMSGALISRTA